CPLSAAKRTSVPTSDFDPQRSRRLDRSAMLGLKAIVFHVALSENRFQFDCINSATAFSNWLAEQAMPRRSSICDAEPITITEGAPSISTMIGAPEYPKFVRHLYMNVLSS